MSNGTASMDEWTTLKDKIRYENKRKDLRVTILRKKWKGKVYKGWVMCKDDVFTKIESWSSKNLKEGEETENDLERTSGKGNGRFWLIDWDGRKSKRIKKNPFRGLLKIIYWFTHLPKSLLLEKRIKLRFSH